MAIRPRALTFTIRIRSNIPRCGFPLAVSLRFAIIPVTFRQERISRFTPGDSTSLKPRSSFPLFDILSTIHHRPAGTPAGAGEVIQ